MTKHTPWTSTEVEMLREMWLCGVASGDIAKVLRRTRNSIMGKIDQQDLMGRKGEGLMARTATSGMGHVIAEIASTQAIDTPAIACDDGETMRVMLAMIACGRRSRRIPAASGVDRRRCARISDMLHASGTWPTTKGPPWWWWRTGRQAVANTVTWLNDMERRHERAKEIA